MDLPLDDLLEIDLRLVKQENAFTTNLNRCPRCPYFSKSQVLMRNHELKHASEIQTFNCATSTIEPFVCRICEFPTHVQRCYIEHIEKIHLKAENRLINFHLKFYTCVTCSFKTFSYFIWLKHKCGDCVAEEESSKKTSPKNYCLESFRLFKCDQCDYKTKWRDYLKRHISNRHVRDKDIEWFTCKDCDYKSKKKENLKRHVTTQHFDDFDVRKHKNKHEDNQFNCDRCEYSSKSLLKMEGHIFSSHETKWYQCDQCKYKSQKSDNVKRHYNSQHLSDEYVTWFQCDECDFKTKRQDALRKHIKHKHEANTEQGRQFLYDNCRWFVCEVCGYKTNIGSNLKRHGISKHGAPKKNGDPKWLMCEMCGYRTIKRANLQRHINSKHLTDECAKWVQCSLCEFRSKHSDNVRKHIRNKHDKLR